jgi:hypothetical protein
MGNTLRGLLLYGYAFATIGTIAAIAAFIGAAVLLVLFAFGLWHARQARQETGLEAPRAVPQPV